jgi:hypothetical protein
MATLLPEDFEVNITKLYPNETAPLEGDSSNKKIRKIFKKY